MSRQNISLDINDLIQRYLSGESEKALAESLGVSRTVIRNRLLRAGIKPRNRSEGMYARMARTNSDERLRLTDAAHRAVRGVPKTLTAREAMACSVEQNGAGGKNVSTAELILGDLLEQRGKPVIYQKAIGPYNADLATGTVAMEILGGNWHSSKHHGKRMRYILDAGWDIIYIWVGKSPWPVGAAEYIISHLEFRDRNPASPCCYRVIRSGGEFIAGGSLDGDELPDIIPNGRTPDSRLRRNPS